MVIVYVLLIALALLFLFSFAYGAISGAPWIPTKKVDVDRMIKFSGVGSGDKFYEMGSGDGRLCAAVAKAGGKAYGFEVAFFPYLISRIRRLFLKNRSDCVFKWKNFWNVDISDADAVYVFLTPEKNVKIAEKLKKEMKKGAKVIAYVWPFEGWEPLKVDEKEDRVNLYLYEI